MFVWPLGSSDARPRERHRGDAGGGDRARVSPPDSARLERTAAGIEPSITQTNIPAGEPHHIV